MYAVKVTIRGRSHVTPPGFKFNAGVNHLPTLEQVLPFQAYLQTLSSLTGVPPVLEEDFGGH